MKSLFWNIHSYCHKISGDGWHKTSTSWSRPVKGVVAPRLSIAILVALYIDREAWTLSVNVFGSKMYSVMPLISCDIINSGVNACTFIIRFQDRPPGSKHSHYLWMQSDLCCFFKMMTKCLYHMICLPKWMVQIWDAFFQYCQSHWSNTIYEKI